MPDAPKWHDAHPFGAKMPLHNVQTLRATLWAAAPFIPHPTNQRSTAALPIR